MTPSFKTDFDLGEQAVRILKRRVQNYFDLESVSGTDDDYRGIDYYLSLNGVRVTSGSHKHTKQALIGKYPIRYKRSTGNPTDFDKLQALPDSHVLSVSYGKVSSKMPIILMTLWGVRKWMATVDIEKYVDPYAHPNASVLYVPINDVAIASCVWPLYYIEKEST